MCATRGKFPSTQFDWLARKEEQRNNSLQDEAFASKRRGGEQELIWRSRHMLYLKSAHHSEPEQESMEMRWVATVN